MSVAGVSKADFGLGLGLGPCLHDQHKFSESCSGELTLTLGLGRTSITNKTWELEAFKSTESTDRLHQQSSSTPSTTIPSFSNSSSIKKERDSGQEDEMDMLVVHSPRASDEDEIGCPRKKLRLTKEQSAVLEESFREHPTLNPRQKQELARKLNLQARQVEVWFQNRRARTKLKQTEVDCQLLKKCCEKLAEENKRLHKELHELKSLKLTAANPRAYSMHLPAATLTVCPSCERIGGDTDESSPIISNAASAGSKVQRHHLYKNNPFRHY